MSEWIYEFPANDTDSFQAYNDAIEFCLGRGYSVGMMQSGSPCAIFPESDSFVAKWRNLSREERRVSIGRLEAIPATSRFSGRPVRVIMYVPPPEPTNGDH